MDGVVPVAFLHKVVISKDINFAKQIGKQRFALHQCFANRKKLADYLIVCAEMAVAEQIFNIRIVANRICHMHDQIGVAFHAVLNNGQYGALIRNACFVGVLINHDENQQG